MSKLIKRCYMILFHHKSNVSFWQSNIQCMVQFFCEISRVKYFGLKFQKIRFEILQIEQVFNRSFISVVMTYP